LQGREIGRSADHAEEAGVKDQSICAACGKPAVGSVQMIHRFVSPEPDPVCRKHLECWQEWAKENTWAKLRIEEYAKA
jgi:hypothetical protein